jgi:hypothetical protein
VDEGRPVAMAAHTHKAGGQGGGTERTDIKLRPILVFTVGLIVMMIAVYLVVMAMFRLFSAQAARQDAASGAQVAQQLPAGQEHLPPEPRIQVNPAADLKVLRQQEDSLLTSYGWVDQKAGIVRIPVAEAMRLVIAQGLPVRQPESAPPASGTPAPRSTPSKGERKIP